jgi:hypothetical protein
MKKARLILSASLLTLGAFSAVTMTSCSKDDETCKVGYEGTDCKTLSRDKFIGNWKGTEACTEGTDEYNIGITAGSGSEITVVYSNVYNQGFTGTGSMTGQNGFSFNGTGAGGVTFSGTATYEAGTGRISVTYKVMTGSTLTNECTFTGTKL